MQKLPGVVGLTAFCLLSIDIKPDLAKLVGILTIVHNVMQGILTWAAVEDPGNFMSASVQLDTHTHACQLSVIGSSCNSQPKVPAWKAVTGFSGVLATNTSSTA